VLSQGVVVGIDGFGILLKLRVRVTLTVECPMMGCSVGLLRSAIAGGGGNTPRDELVVGKDIAAYFNGLIAGLDALLEVALLKVDRYWSNAEKGSQKSIIPATLSYA
jgi:hypothetical protein